MRLQRLVGNEIEQSGREPTDQRAAFPPRADFREQRPGYHSADVNHFHAIVPLTVLLAHPQAPVNVLSRV